VFPFLSVFTFQPSAWFTRRMNAPFYTPRTVVMLCPPHILLNKNGRSWYGSC
jgi:hypothetical protein